MIRVGFLALTWRLTVTPVSVEPISLATVGARNIHGKTIIHTQPKHTYILNNRKREKVQRASPKNFAPTLKYGPAYLQYICGVAEGPAITVPTQAFQHTSATSGR